MLPVTWDTIRVFLHVTAATIWVGGMFTLAGLVPGLRKISPDAPRTVAQRFNLIAWPAYFVLIATGIWNVVAIDPAFDTPYGRTLMVKVVVAIISGHGGVLAFDRPLETRPRHMGGGELADGDRRPVPRRDAGDLTEDDTP